MASESVTRVTANIPVQDVRRLENIAEDIHSNKTTALVRALRTTDLLRQYKADGARIVIIDKDGSQRELVF